MTTRAQISSEDGSGGDHGDSVPAAALHCGNRTRHPAHYHLDQVDWGDAMFWCSGAGQAKSGNPTAHLNAHYGHLGGRH